DERRQQHQDREWFHRAAVPAAASSAAHRAQRTRSSYSSQASSVLSRVIFAFSVRCTEVIVKPSASLSIVTAADVSMRSGTSPASPRTSESAIAKQPACAALHHAL